MMEIRPKAGNLIMHVGMPKTGTSSIQVSLFRRLSDPRFHYVVLGGPGASSNIRTAFKSAPARGHIHVKRGMSVDELRRMRECIIENLGAELRVAGARTAILSAELISNLREREFQELCAVVARQRAAVTAVGYVRRPLDFIESAFQQRVRGGLQEFDESRLSPNYRPRFEKADTVLGRENVQLWLFNPQSFSGNCVVQDFCSRLGIQFRPQDVIRVNESLSFHALTLLFAYRKFGPGYGDGPTVRRENRLLTQRLRNLAGPKLRLHSSLTAPLLVKWREDIEWMEARLGASLAETPGQHDEGAIRSEEDLLRFGPEALEWLAGELGEDYLRRWHPRMTPQEVAEWMHRLRLKLANGDDKIQNGMAVAPQVTAHRVNLGDSVMNIEELVESAKRSAPTLKSIADEDAQSLLRTVFKRIREEVEKTGEGKVKVNGLGQFRIRAGEREKDGHKTQVKRIVFQASKSRGKDKDKDEDEDE